ncbi:uncharacterized protein LOC134705563 [Mytilus trossulus]|uniref:uncharacterized protein LOC134705563 n=1 Tax=Mytilus trossulus TaxID=6551 RepID=UPI003004EF79
MSGLSLVATFGIHLLLIARCNAFMCYSCNGVASPVDCERAINCPADEHCFTDKYLNANGHMLYNLGCKSDRICKLLSTLGGKRDLEEVLGIKDKRSVIHLCTKCCDKGYCNNALCTDSTTPAPNMQCYKCDDIEDLAACETLVACPEYNECFADIFYNDRGDIRHRLGCREKQRCRQFLALGAHVPHGKRQGFAQLCGGCCDSPFCNIKGCETIDHVTLGHHASVSPSSSG